jgi:hypothetical protein
VEKEERESGERRESREENGEEQTQRTLILPRRNADTDNSKYFIVNPVVGPEPLTGSTRMKSGSATKILLEVIFALVYHRVFSLPLCPSHPSSASHSPSASHPASAPASISHPASSMVLPSFLSAASSAVESLNYLFWCYEQTCRATYLKLEELSVLVDYAGKSLRCIHPLLLLLILPLSFSHNN